MLRRYHWGRMPGPLIRLWDSEWGEVARIRGRRESRWNWVKRIARHTRLLVWRPIRRQSLERQPIDGEDPL